MLICMLHPAHVHMTVCTDMVSYISSYCTEVTTASRTSCFGNRESCVMSRTNQQKPASSALKAFVQACATEPEDAHLALVVVSFRRPEAGCLVCRCGHYNVLVAHELAVCNPLAVACQLTQLAPLSSIHSNFLKRRVHNTACDDHAARHMHTVAHML